MSPTKNTSVVCTINFNTSLTFSEQETDIEAQITSQVQAHQAAQEATAVVAGALDTTMTALVMNEITVMGALAYMNAAGISGVTEDAIQTCCKANPETFKYLPAHGLRKASLVSRVQVKNEQSADSGNGSAENVEAVVKAITEEPKRGAAYYKAKFGFDKDQWTKVIDLVLKSGVIDKSGERANRIYFPKAA